MPNYVSNVLVVHDPAGGIAELVASWQGMVKNENAPEPEYDDFFSFEHHLPRPADLAEDRQVAWKTAHWGTKWDAFHVERTQEDAHTLRLRFDTANGDPGPVIEAFAAAHPDFVVAHCHNEEDTESWGATLYTNGEPDRVVDRESRYRTYRTVKSMLVEQDARDGLDELCSDRLGQSIADIVAERATARPV